jgi:ferredoxin
MTDRLHIDWTACRGHGSCAELLEGLLHEDEWGFPVAAGGNDAPIPADRSADARDAVAMCPRLALSLRAAETL